MKLKMGLIGGGTDFLWQSAQCSLLDNRIELVCGAFSHDKTVKTVRSWLGCRNRVYAAIQKWSGRKNLPAAQQMDFVSIVTPNNCILIRHAGFEQRFSCGMRQTVTYSCRKPLTWGTVRQTDLFCPDAYYTDTRWWRSRHMCDRRLGTFVKYW